MKTRVCVLAAVLAAVAAAEPPKAKPLAGWPGVFPEYAGYQRTFEAPEVEAGKQNEYRQAARYEWTGGALKSFRLGVVRGRSVQGLFTPDERKTAMEIKIGKQTGLLLERGEQKVSLLLPLGEDRAVLIRGEGMISPAEVRRLAEGLDFPAITRALDGPPRTDFTRKKEDFAKLRKGMSLAEVSAWVGDADADVGSGIHVLKYKLPDGGAVLLGFADFKSLLYVKHEGPDGKVEDLVK